ncbi:MAG: DUF4097 family beta strand repeat protein [Cyclobacteriaceae bacterium]
MKKGINIAFALILSLGSMAQEFKFEPNGRTSDLQVKINDLSSDLEIIGVEGNKIIIIATNYKGMPEKAKGLKPLSATGSENTGIGLRVTQEGNEVQISGASRSANDGRYQIKLPKSTKLYVDYQGWDGGDVLIENMTSEVEISSNISDLVFKDVTGPIVANTLSSNIEVRFSSLNQSSPTSLSSTSGDIDVSIPILTKGNFDLSTISGEIYTDLDFEIDTEKSDLKRIGGGTSTKATLNGGGVKMSIHCISGNVFIRKGE